MYVPTHLRAHTPYTCGDAMPTGTLTAHACTGRHRSPGAAGRDASLRLLCGAGAGTRLAGSTPQGGAQGRTWDSQPSPLLSKGLEVKQVQDGALHEFLFRKGRTRTHTAVPAQLQR